MKKKILLALIATACLAGGAISIAGCNSTPSNEGGHDHDYEGVELTPIINSDGTSEYHAHKCKVEGCNQTSGAAKHEYETVTTEATCTTAKSVKYTCKYCHYEKTETVGEKLGHTWGDWEITTENMPTENESGKATRTCTVDGCNAVDTTTLTVPQLWVGGKINPVYTDWVLNNTADCENEGTATYTFVNSQNQVHIDFTGKTPALGHDWNETLSNDDDNHFITCKRNDKHIKPDSTAAHTKKTTETASLVYNKQTGKWEHIYVTTCEGGCDYRKEFKGTEADLNDGDGATLASASVGNGTYASPFVITASNTTERTVTIPANTVVSLRYTNLSAMGIFAVLPVDSDNLSVIFNGKVEAVAVGERAKSDPYYGERGASLDFALTTTDGEAATVKFKFFDNDNYYITGNPANVVVDTDYTDEVPEETDVKHTFTPDVDGVYKFTVTGGMAMLDMGRDGTSGGSDFSETLYGGRIYSLYVSTDMDRKAASVTFKIERTGEIPEPELGSANRPIAITEVKEYEVKIEPASWGVSGVYYAFTPSVSGLYKFFDENSAVATYMLRSESATGNMLANSMNNSDESYSYIECELEAGTTYYLCVSSTENKSHTVNMTISLHEHEFATGWTTDAKYHWHAATCEHTDKISDKGAHTYGANGKCTICGMDKIEFNAQITVTDGTNTYDNVTVTAKLADGTLVASGTTASGGVVTLALIPDDYVLELTGLPETYGYVQALTGFSVVDKAINVEAKVYEKQTYSVTVKMPDGTPANGVTVTFMNEISSTVKTTFTAVTNANGEATITEIPPLFLQVISGNGTLKDGIYALSFTMPEELKDYAYVGSNVSVNNETASREITLTQLATYTLTLTYKDGEETKFVEADTQVTIWHYYSGSEVIDTTVTVGENGVATFKAVSTQTYNVRLDNDYLSSQTIASNPTDFNIALTCYKIKGQLVNGASAANTYSGTEVLVIGENTVYAARANAAYYKFTAETAGTYTFTYADVSSTNGSFAVAMLNSATNIIFNAVKNTNNSDGKLTTVGDKVGKGYITITMQLAQGDVFIVGTAVAGYGYITITEVTE